MADRTDTPFVDELPRLLRERGMSLRELARRIEISDSHLSRVVRHADYKSASPRLIGRIARELRLPVDYFPEYREAFVVERVRRDARLRDGLYSVLKSMPRLAAVERIEGISPPDT